MPPIDLTLLAPELWITLLCCLVLAVDFIWPRFSKRGLGYLSIAGLCPAGLMLIGLFRERGALFGGMFVVDSIAVFFKLFMIVVTLLALLASLDAVDAYPSFRGEYYFLILFTALGTMFMASANDFLSLFISLEFATFGFYILVAYLRAEARSNEAGIKFFILGVLSASLIAYGTSLIYGATGSILFTDIAKMPLSESSLGLTIGLLFILVGLGFKIGAVPFHAWIPDVYEGAPTPVTAYLSIAPKAAAFALILRITFTMLGGSPEVWRWLIVAMAILSMTYGNVTAIAQKNIKRLLAYSGIAQIGNLLIGVAAASKMGGDSLLFYLLAYLFANLGAFIVVIVVAGGTQRDDIDDLAGLNRRSPLLAFAMLVFLLSLAGVPPLAGFLAKVYIFTAAVYQDLLLLVTFGLINVIISFYYYLIVVKKMYTLEPSDPAPILISPPMKLALSACIAGVIALGVWPAPLIDLSVATTELFSNLPLR